MVLSGNLLQTQDLTIVFKKEEEKKNYQQNFHRYYAYLLLENKGENKIKISVFHVNFNLEKRKEY